MMTLASDDGAGIAGVSPASCERAGRPRSRSNPTLAGMLGSMCIARGEEESP